MGKISLKNHMAKHKTHPLFQVEERKEEAPIHVFLILSSVLSNVEVDLNLRRNSSLDIILLLMNKEKI